MINKKGWYGILFLFLIGMAVFVVGFYQAITIGMEVTQAAPVPVIEPAPDPVPEVPSGEYHMAVIGDSLAQGIGDPTGEGFVDRVVREMERQTNETVTLYNFAVEGLRSEELMKQTENPQMIQGVAGADYVMISIGGNDLRRIRNMPSEQQRQMFESLLGDYLTHLEQVVQNIRSANETGLIIFLGLYNLDYRNSNAQENTLLVEWNYETHQMLNTYDRTLFVPTYDLFQLHLEQYLSFDGVHPNEQGYQAIADRMISILFQ